MWRSTVIQDSTCQFIMQQKALVMSTWTLSAKFNLRKSGGYLKYCLFNFLQEINVQYVFCLCCLCSIESERLSQSPSSYLLFHEKYFISPYQIWSSAISPKNWKSTDFMHAPFWCFTFCKKKSTWPDIANLLPYLISLPYNKCVSVTSAHKFVHLSRCYYYL